VFQVKLSKKQTSVDVEVKIQSDSDPGFKVYDVLKKTLKVSVKKAPGSRGSLILPKTARPQLFGFAEMGKLAQTSAVAFGPKSLDMFRATSDFGVASGQGDARIYAAVTGTTLIQHVTTSADGTGTAYDEELVNVIIKPLYRSGLGFTPVKYFIYRRLKLADFLAASELELRASGGASEFIAKLYQQQTKRRAHYTEKFGGNTANLPPVTPTSDVLGWNRSRPHTTPLDTLFTSWSSGSDGVVQLPLVTMGECIGMIPEGDAFGVEIVLEDHREDLTLAFARMPGRVLDLSGQQLTAAQERELREHALGYVDPAAYYGMHNEVGVFHRTGVGDPMLKKGAAHFSDIMAPFANKSTVYLDLRNEQGYSLNYYDNYASAEGTVRLNFGVQAKPGPYSTLKWPVVAYNRVEQERKAESVYVALPTTGNTKPVLFAEHAQTTSRTTGNGFVDDSILYVEEQPWSSEVGVQIPQITGAQPTDKTDVATVVKMHYARGVDSEREWPPVSSVPVFSSYTDSVFGPINTLENLDHWKPGASIATRWVNLSEIRFIDGTSETLLDGFRSITERAVAFQEDQVVFFNSAIEIFKVQGTAAAGPMPIGQGVEGGFSPGKNLVGASSLFDGFNPEFVAIKDTPTQGIGEVEIQTLRLVSKDGNAVPSSIMMLGLKAAQFAALVSAAAGLSAAHERNIVLVENGSQPDQPLMFGQIAYHRFEVRVRGLNPAGTASADAAPSPAVYVYTRDGLSFVPAAFTMPTLTPTSYIPNPEELRAQQLNVDPIIALNTGVGSDPGIGDDIEDFSSAIAAIPVADSSNVNDPRVKARIAEKIATYAGNIFSKAHAFVLPDQNDERQDDRQLYWARLRMAIALKSHGYLLANSGDAAVLTKDLEEISRGMRSVSFGVTTLKKVLLVAFDPFEQQPSTGLPMSNPGGVVALALHGTTIESNGPGGTQGIVRSVVLPVRYAEFDSGAIDAFFTEHVITHPADLILVLNQNGAYGQFGIERFAARTRGGAPDNTDSTGLPTVGSGDGWAEFHETSLPITDMMSGNGPGSSDQYLYYDQSASGILSGDTPFDVPHAWSGEPNTTTDAGVDVSMIKEMYEGSAGNDLANEAFYRLAHLAATPAPGPRPSVGLLSIPASWHTGDGQTTKQILEKAADVIGRTLDGLP
jgi:hypothetical protein